MDAIVRARNVLLASGRRTPHEEVDAYRVLAQVSPAAYLPRLVGALRQLGYDRSYDDRPEACLALCEEAVAAARAACDDFRQVPELLGGQADEPGDLIV
ncbi:hypothetical protein [Streptomyces hirsutus]|uniref:hypothetical protein n=1 Tax=Streptomyces hirsutus TaxID=35620 RepID=UPI0036BC3809